MGTWCCACVCVIGGRKPGADVVDVDVNVLTEVDVQEEVMIARVVGDVGVDLHVDLGVSPVPMVVVAVAVIVIVVE